MVSVGSVYGMCSVCVWCIGWRYGECSVCVECV